MADYKDRIKVAIGKYLDKNTPKEKRHNAKPEKEVEEEVLEWCRSCGWDVNVIEAKSTWNERAGRYISQSVTPGYPDISGNTDVGLSIYIELKAPGKRSTLRPEQYSFLLRKINTGCFAVCVDSASYLETIWKAYNNCYNRREFLKSILHEPKVKDKELIFDD